MLTCAYRLKNRYRKGSAEVYRYGFNGKEKDTDGEWGSNTHYDYGFRIYNPAIAKFLSVDPLTKSYPELSPYQYASNNPVWMIDIDGLEGGEHGSNAKGAPSHKPDLNPGRAADVAKQPGSSKPNTPKIAPNARGPLGKTPNVKTPKTGPAYIIYGLYKWKESLKDRVKGVEKEISETEAATEIITRILQDRDTQPDVDDGGGGYAIIHSNKNIEDPSEMHFSIEVFKNEGSVLHTEQVITPSKDTKISSKWKDGEMQSTRIELSNVDNALWYQASMMTGGSTGKYSPVSNSCMTHVCEVLKSGGDEEVPSGARNQHEYIKSKFK